MHLINTGVSQARNDDGALVSTIEWGLAAPGDVDRSNIRFSCSLDSEDFSDCELLVNETTSFISIVRVCVPSNVTCKIRRKSCSISHSRSHACIV